MLSPVRTLVSVAFLFLAPLVTSDRLALTEGGYARVVNLQQYPLSSFTISSWVNVTHFPEGISPIITYLSEDVTSQLAFFLHPEGVGILWGGPSGQSAEAPTGELPLVDRHPRARWVEKKEKQRKKREAVDYSGGLGDIQNILTKRSGTVADNTWAPLNFVDVGEMGVADLMLSGSDPVQKVVAKEEASLYPKAYTDWTNVPFELNMEESVGDKHIHSKNEPPRHRDAHIITSPTGNDDFVYFNWNSPRGKKPPNIPLGNNNWSPVWESTKQNLRFNQEPSMVEGGEKKLDTLTAPPKRKQTWGIDYDPPSAADLSNKWSGVDLNANVYETRPFVTKLLPTKIERPIWPSPNMVPHDHRTPAHVPNISPTQESNLRDEYKPQVPYFTSNNLEITGGQEIRGKKDSSPKLPSSLTTQSHAETRKTTNLPITIQATTKGTTTTTQKPSPETRRPTLLPRRNINPTLYRYTKKRKNISPPTKSPPTKVKEPETQTSSSRLVPLWEIIKKTQKEVESEPSLFEQPQPKNPVYSIPAYSKSSYTSTKRPLHRTIKNSFPEPTLPPIKPSDKREPLQAAASHRKNLHYRSRPVQIPSNVRRPKTTTVRTTSTLPPTTSRRIPYRPTTLIQRVPNYQGYKPETSTEKIKPTVKNLTETSNDQYKTSTKEKPDRPSLQRNKYAYRRFNEFEKTMQDPKLIKEGNTAIVYAVPITNEKEFYEMYKRYQRDSVTPAKSQMNLHDLYHKMRTGGINNRLEMEEEIDGNGIKATRVSLYEREGYPEKYNIVRKSTVQTTSTTTTETPNIREKTTAAPSRSDVPIADYDHPEHSEAEIREKNVQNPSVDGTQNSGEFDEYDNYQYSSTDYEPGYDYYTTNKGEGIVDKLDFPVQSEFKTVLSGSENSVKTDSQTNNGLEDQISLVDLYRPKESTSNIHSQIVPSNFQDQQSIYLDQLPPQYQKPEKQYDFDTTTPENPSNKAPIAPPPQFLNERLSSQPIYSFNPHDLLSQGLIPRPIHVVGSQDEADEWMRRHDANVDKSPFLLSEGQETASANISPLSLSSSLPRIEEQVVPVDEITPVAKPEALDSSKLPLDIHFEKTAYPFKENTWYHLALTWNARTKLAAIYVNGERIGVINNVLEGHPHLKEGGLFLIGKTLLPDLSDFDESSQFVGEISDLNMWATELSPMTMDAVFQCKYDPISPQPVEWRTTELKLYDQAAMTPSPPLCGLIT